MPAFTSESVIQYYKGTNVPPTGDPSENADWVEPMKPQSMDILYQDVDFETGRTADGMMHRNKVGMKIKTNLSYPPMKYEQAKDLLALVVSPTVADFYVRFIDPVQNLTTPTIYNVYVGDRTAPVYSTGLQLFNAMSFDLIEM